VLGLHVFGVGRGLALVVEGFRLVVQGPDFREFVLRQIPQGLVCGGSLLMLNSGKASGAVFPIKIYPEI
jgi:hypothetical protein